ncbi:hypothetical protein ACF0H5_014989 [Mactra antiquata]
MWLLILTTCVALNYAQSNYLTDTNLGPVLSSPGTMSSVLVFLDIHQHYDGNSCSDPDWTIYEMALTLQYKANKQLDSGIEIYDTCGSKTRVAEIIRYRLAPSSCDYIIANLSSISGVISYSSQEINKLLHTHFDQLLLILGEGHTDDIVFKSSGDVYLEISSLHNVQMMLPLMNQLNWTYVTLIYDDHPDSLQKKTLFQTLADDNDICIQSSLMFEDFTQILDQSVDDIKTDGMIIIANQLWHRSQIVAMATTDENGGKIGQPLTGILFEDAYSADDEITQYVANDLWNMTSLNDITKEYYMSVFGCTYVNENVSTDIVCDAIPQISIETHFNQVTKTRLFQVFNQAFSFQESVTNSMNLKNCTNYHRLCFNEAEMVPSASIRVVNASVTETTFQTKAIFVHKDNKTEEETFQTIDFIDVNPPVAAWLGNVSDIVQPSVCKSWCPSCWVTKCSSASNQDIFDGEYVYIPGDVLITGLLPRSERWNKVFGDGVCSGIKTTGNVDILSDAFLYAVLTAQTRYQDLLPDATFGVLLFDTCDDMKRASQILLNFESCQYNFKVDEGASRPSPVLVPSYVIVGQEKSVPNDLFELDKLTFALDDYGNIQGNSGAFYDSSVYNFEAVVHFLNNASLSYVGVVTSGSDKSNNLKTLHELSASKNICIEYHETLSSTNLADVIDVIQESSASVVLVFAEAGDVDRLFRSLTTRPFVKTWILMETRQTWLDITSFPLPLGSVVFHRQGKQNRMFDIYLNNILKGNSSNKSITNPWFDSSTFSADTQTLVQASDVIKTVDITLDTLQRAVKSVCGNSSTTLCKEFLDQGPIEMIKEMTNVWFTYQEEMIKITTNDEMYENYIISNLQTNGLVEVGRWLDQQLIMSPDKLKSYSSKGSVLPEFRESYCFSSRCTCVNINSTTGDSSTDENIVLDYEMAYKANTGEFQKDLWVLIVVIIAGTGSLITLFLMIYIMCKVCAGALVRRYLALGLLLLVAMVFLFLSVLPFLFSPSENVCGMRFFAHGFSYALCFGVILAKMMTLRDYRYIGLGGEISRINQLLTVFFIISVQIAIGVQWWVLRSPVVFTETLRMEIDGTLQNVTFYACDFVREDFISYHSYVIFLVVLCCLYGLSVRRETKNMKEARLLLICSWVCLIFWIAVIVTLIILDRKYLEAICSIGILANALTMMVVIYLPKLTAISRLKYEVSENNMRKENGYKLDTDFQYERPYSLPGTLRSSITDKALTYPRSLATFDTSLSY